MSLYLNGPVPKDKWITTGDNCVGCKKSYGVFGAKKKNCPYCGRLLCNDCVNAQITVSVGSAPDKVCVDCFAGIQNSRQRQHRTAMAGSGPPAAATSGTPSSSSNNFLATESSPPPVAAAEGPNNNSINNNPSTSPRPAEDPTTGSSTSTPSAASPLTADERRSRGSSLFVPGLLKGSALPPDVQSTIEQLLQRSASLRSENDHWMQEAEKSQSQLKLLQAEQRPASTRRSHKRSGSSTSRRKQQKRQRPLVNSSWINPKEA